MKKSKNIEQAKANLQVVIKSYVEKTHTLGIELDYTPIMKWCIDSDDYVDCYITHLSFTDKGELADVSLLSRFTTTEAVICADDFWNSGADFNEVADEILYETK